MAALLTKDETRAAAKAARAGMTPERRAEAARSVAGQLLALPEFRAARRVLVYAPLPDELDPLGCFSASWNRRSAGSALPTGILPTRMSSNWRQQDNTLVSKAPVGSVDPGAPPVPAFDMPQLVWPRVADRARRLLTLHACTEEELAPAGSFGLREPRADAPQVALADIDVALVPGLAFDAAGYRVGYGGGYYDRLLADAPAKLLTIGLCFQETFYPAIPHDPHDIPVTRVLLVTK